MTTTKAAERAKDLAAATWTLESLRGHFAADGLLLVSATYGSGTTDYFRLSAVENTPKDAAGQMVWHVTWAAAKMFGYSLRDKNGYYAIAMNGGGYSKPFELARSLASYYGLERIRYEII